MHGVGHVDTSLKPHANDVVFAVKWRLIARGNTVQWTCQRPDPLESAILRMLWVFFLIRPTWLRVFFDQVFCSLLPFAEDFFSADFL